MKKIFILFSSIFVFVAIFCLSVYSPIGGGALADTNYIKIGGVLPESGTLKDIGLAAAMGAQVAFDEINANGGINGKQIKFIRYDSKNDLDTITSSAKRLVSEGVCAIIGDLTSTGFVELREIANDSKTVALSPGATSPHTTERAVGSKYERVPFAFRISLQDEHGVERFLTYLVKTKRYERYALITTDNVYSEGLSRIFKDKMKSSGGKIVVEERITDGPASVEKQISSIKKHNVDAIIFTGYPTEAIKILQEKQKQGINKPLVGGSGMMSSRLWMEAGDAALGTMIFSGYAADEPAPDVQDFKIKIRDQGQGVDATTYSANGYEAARLLAQVLEETKVTDCSNATQRDLLRQGLTNVKSFRGISGAISFDETGSAIKKPYFVEIVKDKTSGEYRTSYRH